MPAGGFLSTVQVNRRKAWKDFLITTRWEVFKVSLQGLGFQQPPLFEWTDPVIDRGRRIGGRIEVTSHGDYPIGHHSGSDVPAVLPDRGIIAPFGKDLFPFSPCLKAKDTDSRYLQTL